MVSTPPPARPLPGTRLPDVSFPLLDGGEWRPGGGAALLDLYRGLHCPRCRTHLEGMAEFATEFAGASHPIVAVSMDPSERAERARTEWALDGIALGHSLREADARALGAFVSTAIRDAETGTFAEPATLVVDADGTLYGGVWNSFPFARPAPADLLEILSVRAERGYPPRGTRA